VSNPDLIEAVRKLAEAVRTVAADCGSIYAADLANRVHALLAAEKTTKCVGCSGRGEVGGPLRDGSSQTDLCSFCFGSGHDEKPVEATGPVVRNVGKPCASCASCDVCFGTGRSPHYVTVEPEKPVESVANCGAVWETARPGYDSHCYLPPGHAGGHRYVIDPQSTHWNPEKPIAGGDVAREKPSAPATLPWVICHAKTGKVIATFEDELFATECFTKLSLPHFYRIAPASAPEPVKFDDDGCAKRSGAPQHTDTREWRAFRDSNSVTVTIHLRPNEHVGMTAAQMLVSVGRKP
jgi:hypothetical protein